MLHLSFKSSWIQVSLFCNGCVIKHRIITHPAHSDVSVRNAPTTLHGCGAFDMKEIHLLKGDNSLSIKKRGRGSSTHCLWLSSTAVRRAQGGTLLHSTAGSMFSFMWIYLGDIFKAKHWMSSRPNVSNGNSEPPAKQSGHSSKKISNPRKHVLIFREVYSSWGKIMNNHWGAVQQVHVSPIGGVMAQIFLLIL